MRTRITNDERTMLPMMMNGRWPCARLRRVLGCLLFISLLRCEAQNLVPNPSFEIIDSCPQAPFVLGYQPGAVPQHWFSFSDTPDYFNACEDTAVADVPTNVFGFQYAMDGQAYSGMAARLQWDYREMIGVELLAPLVPGQTYYGNFWANAAYGGPQQTGGACNNIGMLMTMAPYPWVLGMPGFALRNYAQIYSEQVVADTIGWTLVSGSFVADSAYRYLVLGNHFTNDNTVVQVLGPGDPNKAYVQVDGICLSVDPEGCPMMMMVDEVTSAAVVLWPNPCDELMRVSWRPLPMGRVLVNDIAGKRVAEEQTLGRMDVMFDTHAWANGLYHVVLEGESGKQLRKFVVMH